MVGNSWKKGRKGGGKGEERGGMGRKGEERREKGRKE